MPAALPDFHMFHDDDDIRDDAFFAWLDEGQPEVLPFPEPDDTFFSCRTCGEIVQGTGAYCPVCLSSGDLD